MTIDLEAIAKTNPNVDLNLVKNAERALKALRAQGFVDAQYNLARPFSPRESSVSEADLIGQKPRTISYTR